MGQTVRCKFQCTQITKTKHWNEPRFLYTACFSAVSDGSEENKRFFEYTPSGKLEVGQYKEDAFEVGKMYYIDITLTD